MMRIYLMTMALVGFASAAFAECATPDDTFLSCTFSNGLKEVHACVDGPNMTYAFGLVGEDPYLFLSVPVVDADFVPWPGVGSTIFESVHFTNGKIAYEVTGGLRREYPEDENEDIKITPWGMIHVTEKTDAGTNEELAVMSCDVGGVVYAYGGSIFDAKTAAGQCWDFDEKRWGVCK